MELYLVTNEDNLWCDRVGSLIWESSRTIFLDLGNEKEVFKKEEVEKL